MYSQFGYNQLWLTRQTQMIMEYSSTTDYESSNLWYNLNNSYAQIWKSQCHKTLQIPVTYMTLWRPIYFHFGSLTSGMFLYVYYFLAIQYKYTSHVSKHVDKKTCFLVINESKVNYVMCWHCLSSGLCLNPFLSKNVTESLFLT